ncbi:MAG: Fic family protein [Candidatus Dormibacteria bacterium]|jgi:Fic family protein
MRGRYEPGLWEWNPGIYAPARYRKGCRYDAFVPDLISESEIELPGALAGIVSDAEQAIAHLNSAARPELLPLARLLLRTESIASSKVEGLQVETRQLARAEAKQDVGRSIGPESAEILANIDAMQLAIERAVGTEELIEADLLDVHRLILKRSRTPGLAGHFREVQNWIGGNDYNPCGADFVPPPPEQLPTLLADLCRFCNDDALPPIVQAAIAHAQFETIHPFEDGNGRTGRALVQVILRRRGLAPTFVPPLSVVLAHDKERYIGGLTVYREDRLAEWSEIFASASVRAAQLAERYIDSVDKLQRLWREQLRAKSRPRSDAAAWDLIKVLAAHPVVTVPVAVAATNRTRPAVANGLEELEAAGVLLRLKDSPGRRAWEATGVLDLIEELDSGAWLSGPTDGYVDEDGRIWPWYSQSEWRAGSRAVVEFATTDVIDIGDNMPTSAPGLSEVVVRKVPTDHGTNFNLVVRVPTEQAFGERQKVLENARRLGELPADYPLGATRNSKKLKQVSG